MKKSLPLAAAMLCSFAAFSQTKTDILYNDFVTPPAAAKPRVWWHWMNGNITKEGIAKAYIAANVLHLR